MSAPVSEVRLDQRVAIVTGAARGQGEAESRCLLGAGATVVLTDVLVDEGRRLVEDLGGRASFAELNVSDQENWGAVTADTLSRFGRVDVLVNNAGIHWVHPLVEETLSNFERMLSVNLVGPFLGMQAVSGVMIDQGSGSIINVSSSAGLGGLWGNSAYASSKWGLRGLAKTAAVELGPSGIRVNTIFPGPVNTSMMRQGDDDRFLQLPLGRFATADEIAPLVLFLASDAASFLTGAEIAVDGGMTSKIFGGGGPS
jgi:3alpha(or 20beta)-hydroxysteroid dehydrogenase